MRQILHGVIIFVLGAAMGLAPTILGQARDSKENGRRYIVLVKQAGGVPFSDGVLVGNTLYLAGRLGLDPKTRRLPDTIEDEARNALDGIKATLAEAGMTMDDLVSVQVFCSDVSVFDKFNAVYRPYFGEHYPARAFLGSGTLLAGAHFEIQGVAVKR